MYQYIFLFLDTMGKKKEVKITFSGDEIQRCTVMKNEQLIFMPKLHPPEINKEHYGNIFEAKLQLLTGRTNDDNDDKKEFNIKDGFRASGTQKLAVYFECPEGSRMSISYAKADLKEATALVATWKFDCEECIRMYNVQKRAESSSNANVLPFAPIVSGDVDLNQSDRENFEAIFNRVQENVAKYHEAVKKQCLETTNPLNTLISQKAHFGIGVNSAFINAIPNLITFTSGIKNTFLQNNHINII